MLPLSLRLMRASLARDATLPRDLTDPTVPFELRDVTRGLVTALRTVEYPHPHLLTALRRYAARGHAVGRPRDAVARDAAQLATRHGLERTAEDERPALLGALITFVLGAYDNPELT